MVLLLAALFASDLYCASRAEMGSDDSASKPELVLQTGHSKVVQAVVFSPDGRWLATGSFDNTIKIWDVETGNELRSLTGHLGAVKSLACSVDGKWLASGGNDNSIRIWNVESGQEIAKFDGQDGTTDAIAFSSDSKLLASGGSGNIVVVREAVTGQIIDSFTGHTGSVSAVAFSPDGRYLASGSGDHTVKIWDVSKRKLIKTLSGHTEKIIILRFSENGETLASGALDKSVRLWKTSTGHPTSVLQGTGLALTLAFAPADRLMSVDTDRSIKVWDVIGKGVLISTADSKTEASDGDAESAALSFDGTILAIGNGAGTITLSDTKTGASLKTLENHTVGYYGATFSPDRTWIASAGFDNTVKLWDLQTGRNLPSLRGHTGRVTAVAFLPDSKRIVSGSVDHSIRIWDAVSGNCLDVLNGHTNSVGTIAVGRNSGRIVSGSSDQTVGIWDQTGKREPHFLKGHSGEVVSVAISPDEKLIVSGSTDATIKVWDTETGTPVLNIEPRSGEIDAVAFGPDGKLIVSGGTDKALRIWETKTGRLLKTLSGHTGKINSVSFSPDGLSVVSSSQDKTVRVWNVMNGTEVRTMTGHAGTVFSAEYSWDGQFLASASDDGSIIIWRDANGDRLSTLISLRNSDDWLVVSPTGFFDGSPASWQQLSWRFERNTFNIKPVEVFFNEFYSPGLLGDIISGRQLPANLNISNKDRRQPQIRLMVADVQTGRPIDKRDIKVNITVSKAPAGAEDVRLFRNGALVKVWRGDVLKGQSSVTLETTLPVVAGENRLTAYAFNHDDIKSGDAMLIVIGAGGHAPKGVGYILAAGVNEYANPAYNLTFAVADAQDFAEEMRAQQIKLNNYLRVEVVSIKDSAATKANILKALSDLSAKIQPEDALIIYFAGHGTAQHNRFYLIPHDLGYTGSRTELDDAGLRSILSHSISDQELEAAVEGLDAGQLILVIDACNSGQALEAEEKRLGPMNSKGLAQLAYEKGMYILTAAQSYQAAKEATRLGHGFLTYALIEEGLKTNAADREPKDGQILLREWLDYATARVPQMQEDDLKTRQLEREKSKSTDKASAQDIQRPRVFYRRETERTPMVIARH